MQILSNEKKNTFNEIIIHVQVFKIKISSLFSDLTT